MAETGRSRLGSQIWPEAALSGRRSDLAVSFKFGGGGGGVNFFLIIVNQDRLCNQMVQIDWGQEFFPG